MFVLVFQVSVFLGKLQSRQNQGPREADRASRTGAGGTLSLRAQGAAGTRGGGEHKGLSRSL